MGRLWYHRGCALQEILLGRNVGADLFGRSFSCIPSPLEVYNSLHWRLLWFTCSFIFLEIFKGGTGEEAADLDGLLGSVVVSGAAGVDSRITGVGSRGFS